MIMYEPPVGGSIFVAWLRGRFDAYLSKIELFLDN